MKIARRWQLHGRIQGVGFRHHVKTNAVALGVVGWVRTLVQGDCVVHGEGDEHQLRAFEERVLAASGYASRIEAACTDVPLEHHSSFEILH